MTPPRFTRFLTLAREYTGLIIDLCAEADGVSRAQLLHYLEHHGVAPALKENLIDDLLQTAILLPEHDHEFTVNPAVVDLVNYYERRGRLISATFLRDQMSAMAELSDRLQRELFGAEITRELVLDLIDDLYRLVREVREAGLDHYVACMRLLGDIKRAGDSEPLERRLADLETAQRRYIDPLRGLIDPSGEYVPRIAQLRRLVGELGQQTDLLAQSQELDSRRRRLLSDLQFIDYELLRGFGAIVDAARTLLKSLMDEKSIKDALAFCLGQIDRIWDVLSDTTVVAGGRNTIQAASADRIEAFFADVVHRRLLPQPRPLDRRQPDRSRAEDLVLTDERIWQTIARAGRTPSWPAFVTASFRTYSEEEQLRAMVLPLLRSHAHVRVDLHVTMFNFEFQTHHLHMKDFGVRWEEHRRA
ncbi:MAG: hypothetical protein M3R24_00245 [Chloroflexota bacterium]|nr:hypothetical protein [Chloroflexota bacterium]